MPVKRNNSTGCYTKYMMKEAKKHKEFAKRFVDPNSIDW